MKKQSLIIMIFVLVSVTTACIFVKSCFEQRYSITSTGMDFQCLDKSYSIDMGIDIVNNISVIVVNESASSDDKKATYVYFPESHRFFIEIDSNRIPITPQHVFLISNKKIVKVWHYNELGIVVSEPLENESIFSKVRQGVLSLSSN